MLPNTSIFKRSGSFCVRLIAPGLQTRFSLLKGIFLLFVLTLFNLAAIGSWAADLKEELNSPEIPWHITADELSYDDQTKIYTARGNVLITKADKTISADLIRFDHQNMKVFASGHVVVSTGSDVIAADSLTLDMTTEQGHISNGSFYTSRGNFHLRSDDLQKIDKDTYRAKKASVTTCDGETPDWKITGRNLKVTIEGYGTAYHAAFWIKKVPVLYSPWIGFPVKIKRQTGLLAPQISYSSRKGYQYNQPLFWAISKNSDATFYWHHMTERGNKFGAEYRYALTHDSKGTTMFDYLDDRQIDDTTGKDGTGSDATDWGYQEDEGDDILRLNTDRYWFRTKNDQELPWRFNAVLDMDVVSDQDYLNEFKRGYTGFQFTRNYYNKTFGRDIDDYDEDIRLNRFNINRSWSRYNMNAEVRWYDDVVTRVEDEPDTTVQQLPFVQFKGSKQTVFKTPFMFDLKSEYTHFYRESTTTTNSVTQDHRVDIYPRVYLPMNLGYLFTFEPSAGLRETVWNIQAYETLPADEKEHEFQNREMYDIQLDLKSEIYRIFRGGQDANPLKHTLTPRVTYNYIPDYNQEAYPDFDDIDRIEHTNEIDYSISNLFIIRRPMLQSNSSQGDKPAYRYHQIARFDIGQSYDFIEAYETDPENWENGETQEPFSPVSVKLEFTPEYYFSLSADAEWSIYDNEAVSHNISTAISDRRNDRLYVEHRYTLETDEDSEDGINSFFGEASLQVTRPLALYTRYEHDFFSDKELETSFGILYDAQCWTLDLRYTRDEDEIIYSFEIQLYGIGGIGSGIEHDDVESRF